MKDKTIITIVLTVAATALIGFGIYSFTNYQQAKFEHEFETRQAAAETLEDTSPSEPQVPEVSSPPAPVAPPTPPVAVSPPVSNLPPATESEVFGQGTPETRSPAAIAAAESRARFEQMRLKEEALLRDLQQGRTGTGNSGTSGISTGPTSPVGGNDSILGQGSSITPPPAAPVLDRYQEEIQNEAAIARVTHFDEGMNFLVISGGQDRNIASGDKFAVRRGTDIVGYVKVKEVMVNESIASLVSANRDSVTAVKPQVGDDLISYDRFALGAQR